jgi:hypothetical protein
MLRATPACTPSLRWPVLSKWGGAVLLASMLATTAAAQSEPTADSTAAGWHLRYDQARSALLAGRFEEADREFSALQYGAPTPIDRSLAIEFASFARSEIARRKPQEQPSLRTSDELAVLYTTAVFYGLGTSGWFDLQLKPQSFGAAFLPFAVITPAAVGIVALADNYRPLRHGIPQSIAAGLYLGFGEGLWLVAYQNAYASHHTDTANWGSSRVATALWISSTVGAVAGGAIGALRRPTPGRVSFTSSTTIWGGLISAFATSALVQDQNHRSESSYLVGAIGYNVGLVGGLLFGPAIAPSVWRVRFTDLGGLAGALLGGGASALITKDFTSRTSMGAAAIGGVVGLGLTWLATSGMPPDRSHDQLRPGVASRPTGLASLQPTLAPTRGGFVAGLTGAL